MNEERARLFVALELPEGARSELADWRTGLLLADGSLRPVAPASLHVTLCFLGWRPAGEVPRIAAACETVGEHPVVELSLGKPRWLPARRPRALAVELEDRGGTLAELQSALSAVLSAGGWYEPEARRFLAHVTVARVGKGQRVRRGLSPGPPASKLTARTVTLFRSRLAPGGARYEPLASVALRS